MSTYSAKIHWTDDGEGFLSNNYSRAHYWTFDGGLTVPASSSPNIVPLPMSEAANVDPEEAFVASISSCHMLWFLSIAAKEGISVVEYSDEAVGTMGMNKHRQLAILRVELNPHITLVDGLTLSSSIAKKIHSSAHKHCFIANSVHTEILVNIGDER